MGGQLDGVLSHWQLAFANKLIDCRPSLHQGAPYSNQIRCKCPDGLMIVPQKESEPLTWDLTVVYPLADSYIEASARDPGLAMEQAALRIADKYSVLGRTHIFQPVAVETFGPMNSAAYSFSSELRQKIPAISGEDRESSFVFQHIPVFTARYTMYIARYCCCKSSICLSVRDVDVPWAYVLGYFKSNYMSNYLIVPQHRLSSPREHPKIRVE